MIPGPYELSRVQYELAGHPQGQRAVPEEMLPAALGSCVCTFGESPSPSGDLGPVWDGKVSPAILKGYLAHEKTPTPDHHRALAGMGLL